MDKETVWQDQSKESLMATTWWKSQQIKQT